MALGTRMGLPQLARHHEEGPGDEVVFRVQLHKVLTLQRKMAGSGTRSKIEIDQQHYKCNSFVPELLGFVRPGSKVEEQAKKLSLWQVCVNL